MVRAKGILRQNFRLPVWSRLGLAVLLWLAASPASAQQAAGHAGRVKAAAAQVSLASKETIPGVENFGRVTAQLYRGAQPTAEGFDQLQSLGVKIIVDFRDEKGAIERERKAIEERRLQFVSIPWNARHDPTPEQVREFFEVLRAHPAEKIFAHCHYGADRTGTMVAAYRIAGQGWTADEAVREMKAYHLHHFWLPNLGRYIRKFPHQLESDPSLRGALASPQSASP